MATVVSLGVVARVPTRAAPSGSSRRRGANRVPGCKQEAQDSRRIKSVAARSSPVDVEEPETKTKPSTILSPTCSSSSTPAAASSASSGGFSRRTSTLLASPRPRMSRRSCVNKPRAASPTSTPTNGRGAESGNRVRDRVCAHRRGPARHRCAARAAAVIAVPLFLGLGFKGSEATGL